MYTEYLYLIAREKEFLIISMLSKVVSKWTALVWSIFFAKGIFIPNRKVSASGGSLCGEWNLSAIFFYAGSFANQLILFLNSSLHC